jgi:hypothetical protein
MAGEIRKRLVDEGKNPTLSEYFYDKKARGLDKDEEIEVQNLQIEIQLILEMIFY